MPVRNPIGAPNNARCGSRAFNAWAASQRRMPIIVMKKAPSRPSTRRAGSTSKVPAPSAAAGADVAA